MMFNPFVRFDERFIEGFLRLNKQYLVSQTFNRCGAVSETGKPIMLSHYGDPGLAKIHYKAVASDRYASIIDLGNDLHCEKLKSMLSESSPYRVYSSLITHPALVKSFLNRTLKERMRRYLDNVEDLHLRREQTVVPKLECTFGELFLAMRFGNQVLKVKLEEIENY